MSIRDKDANVMQKIGIHFREKQDYERACDLLERVLDARKQQHQANNKKPDGKNSKRTTDLEIEEDEDIDQYKGRQFATLYNDLALTYLGMEDFEYAQEYLVLAIQCLEQLQQDFDDNTLDKDGEEPLEEKYQGLQELAESYILLADLLRKQTNIE